MALESIIQHYVKGSQNRVDLLLIQALAELLENHLVDLAQLMAQLHDFLCGGDAFGAPVNAALTAADKAFAFQAL